MTATRRGGGQRRKQETETAILDAAERMFGRHGIDGVSLRQIGVAAGSANNFGVQYHFRDKERLIRAIFERRLPALEVRRAQLLAEAKRADRMNDPRALLEVILRPLAEETDSAGSLTYAAFLLGLNFFEREINKYRMSELAPLTDHVIALLQALTPSLSDALFRNRSGRAYMIFIAAMVEWDHARASGQPSFTWQQIVAEALDQATGCLLAPVSSTLLGFPTI